jgi:hypothetical protein
LPFFSSAAILSVEFDRNLKWRQEERIAAILETEDAEQEAVHEKYDGGP